MSKNIINALQGAALGLLICVAVVCIAWMFKSEPKFVRITPVKATMDLMLVSGTLGKSGATETYFLSAIEEDMPFYEGERIKLRQGFIVLKLSRQKGDGEMNKAYELLDSVRECERYSDIDTSEGSNWSVNEKAYCRLLSLIENGVKTRFYDNVKVYVEEEAIQSGISNKAYLKYEQ